MFIVEIGFFEDVWIITVFTVEIGFFEDAWIISMFTVEIMRTISIVIYCCQFNQLKFFWVLHYKHFIMNKESGEILQLKEHVNTSFQALLFIISFSP